MNIESIRFASIKPLRPGAQSAEQQLAAARELKKAYQDFVGKTFFGQMLKAMRSTVGKPAYFHGGQAEEMFRGQLDQFMADHMSDASAAQIADPMFARQFPQQARLLAEAAQNQKIALADLDGLRRA